MLKHGNTKPLIRWNLGKSHEDGHKCLNLAIQKALDIFSEEFDFCVAKNHSEINLSIRTVQQQWDFRFNEILNPSPTMWKFCPSRLNMGGYEIFLDNDVALVQDHPELRKALNRNVPTIGRGWKHLYGSIQSYIQTDHPICSAVIILPPYYDITSKLIFNWKELGKPKLTGPLDEQGLVAYTMLKDNATVLSEGAIPNLVYSPTEMRKITDYAITGKECGYHFIGANRGTNEFLRTQHVYNL